MALARGAEVSLVACDYRECGARVLAGCQLPFACDAKRTEMREILTHFAEHPRASIVAGHGMEMVLAFTVSSTTKSTGETP